MKLDELIAELVKARRAQELLGDVWAYMDAYTGKLEMSPELLKKIRDYFKFDDSE